MGCGNKTKETCGEVTYATCVDYEGDLGKNSKITDNCVTIQETTEDLYYITDDIITDLDMSDLGDNCLTYPLIEGSVRPKTVLKVHEDEICEIKEKLEDLNNLKNLDITSWNLNLDCLSDQCNNPVTTLGSLLEAIVSITCGAETTINQ